MPPPTLRCWATDDEGELEELATLRRRSIEELFNRFKEAALSRSREFDLSLPPGDRPSSMSKASINSFTCSGIVLRERIKRVWIKEVRVKEVWITRSMG